MKRGRAQGAVSPSPQTDVLRRESPRAVERSTHKTHRGDTGQIRRRPFADGGGSYSGSSRKGRCSCRCYENSGGGAAPSLRHRVDSQSRVCGKGSLRGMKESTIPTKGLDMRRAYTCIRACFVDALKNVAADERGGAIAPPPVREPSKMYIVYFIFFLRRTYTLAHRESD